MLEIASIGKLAWHQEKLLAYLRGEPIFPATIELDLTTECGHGCPECPSTTSPRASHLHMHLLERLFGWAEGHTQGLILSGGEPTLASTFHDALRQARLHGFVDVVVVTNGSRLDNPDVTTSLLAHASAVRVSLYDWTAQSLDGLAPTWKRIEELRSLIQRDGSSLQIGVSALTNRENAKVLGDVAQQASRAGAHWIYFHPTCTHWDIGTPQRADQTGVLEAIRRLQRRPPRGLHVFTLPERYSDTALHFEVYHTAHFLLPIGADGRNYLSTEMKYQRPYAIADLSASWHPGWLWDRKRLARISEVNSQNYPAMDSRYRGLLYSHEVESLASGGPAEDSAPVDTNEFLFPHIL